jgi:hypothetical protein
MKRKLGLTTLKKNSCPKTCGIVKLKKFKKLSKIDPEFRTSKFFCHT